MRRNKLDLQPLSRRNYVISDRSFSWSWSFSTSLCCLSKALFLGIFSTEYQGFRAQEWSKLYRVPWSLRISLERSRQDLYALCLISSWKVKETKIYPWKILNIVSRKVLLVIRRIGRIWSSFIIALKTLCSSCTDVKFDAGFDTRVLISGFMQIEDLGINFAHFFFNMFKIWFDRFEHHRGFRKETM